MLLTGLSGNEIYCLAHKGWSPGELVLGNSVHSLGFVRGLTTGFQTMTGGELDSITNLISDGRHAALKRMEDEATRHNANGVTGVVSDLKNLSGMVEFLAVGSSVKNTTHTGPFFTTACSGQDLYCQIDAGYEPRHFVMGNVAYALGLGRGIMAALRGFSGGEVKEFSQMYQPHAPPGPASASKRRPRSAAPTRWWTFMTHILPFGPGRQGNADGRHRLAQPHAGQAGSADHVGADRRGVVEPDPRRLSAGAADAGHVGLRPGLRRRPQHLFPIVHSAARWTR